MKNCCVITDVVMTLLVPMKVTGEHGGPVVRASDSGARGRGFDPYSGCCVVSLSKIYLLHKSTVNTREAVAPSRH